jgi:hypothetical protein
VIAHSVRAAAPAAAIQPIRGHSMRVADMVFPAARRYFTDSMKIVGTPPLLTSVPVTVT